MARTRKDENENGVGVSISLRHEPDFAQFAVNVLFERVGQFIIFRVGIVVGSTVGNDPVEIGDEESRVNVITVF